MRWLHRRHASGDALSLSPTGTTANLHGLSAFSSNLFSGANHALGCVGSLFHPRLSLRPLRSLVDRRDGLFALGGSRCRSIGAIVLRIR